MTTDLFSFIAPTKGRIDKIITDSTPYSRTEVQQLISNGQVVVNGEIIVRKSGFIVMPGTKISLARPKPKAASAQPESIPLDIIYEDEDIAIINKPQGMVVHPAPGHKSGTLVNALIHHFETTLSSGSDIFRPGIVHRIDKDTSGLLVIAKNDAAHHFLADELKAHQIKRVYYALVENHLDNSVMHINLPIGRDAAGRQRMTVSATNSKMATTHVYLVKNLPTNQALVRCELETGRTHQIRVHLAYVKHPVVGDPVYGRRLDAAGQRLHAAELELIHPTTGKLMHFTAPLPEWARL